MPRLDVEICEETRQGLVWAAAYYQLSLDKTVMFLLATLAEFTKRIVAQLEQEAKDASA